MDTLLATARSDLRFALEVLLREEPGIAVVGTATGTEGLLALMKSTSPDLVVLDWNLPGRPPADLIAAARVLDDPPYIIVLGKDSASRQAAQDAGADAFVLRGDPPGELLAAIRHSRSLRTAPSRHFPTKAKGE
jgi:DNA-binding NarL/FixJ family response regulator